MRRYTEEQIEKIKTFNATIRTIADTALELEDFIPFKLDEEIGKAVGPLVALSIKISNEIKQFEPSYEPPAFINNKLDQIMRAAELLIDLL